MADRSVVEAFGYFGCSCSRGRIEREERIHPQRQCPNSQSAAPRFHAAHAFFETVVGGGDAEADVAFAVEAVAAPGGDHDRAFVDETGVSRRAEAAYVLALPL